MKKIETITLRVSKEDKQLIKFHSQKNRLSISSYILNEVISKINNQ